MQRPLHPLHPSPTPLCLMTPHHHTITPHHTPSHHTITSLRWPVLAPAPVPVPVPVRRPRKLACRLGRDLLQRRRTRLSSAGGASPPQSPTRTFFKKRSTSSAPVAHPHPPFMPAPGAPTGSTSAAAHHDPEGDAGVDGAAAALPVGHGVDLLVAQMRTSLTVDDPRQDEGENRSALAVVQDGTPTSTSIWGVSLRKTGFRSSDA